MSCGRWLLGLFTPPVLRQDGGQIRGAGGQPSSKVVAPTRPLLRGLGREGFREDQGVAPPVVERLLLHGEGIEGSGPEAALLEPLGGLGGEDEQTVVAPFDALQLDLANLWS